MSGRHLLQRDPGYIGPVVGSHLNSQGEFATIERAGGEFVGQVVLCLYDDETPVVAPMLLDVGMRAWLRSMLDQADTAVERVKAEVDE